MGVIITIAVIVLAIALVIAVIKAVIWLALIAAAAIVGLIAWRRVQDRFGRGAVQ